MAKYSAKLEGETKCAARLLYACSEAAWKFLQEYENKRTPWTEKALLTAIASTGGAVLNAVDEMDPDKFLEAASASYCAAEEFYRFVQRGSHAGHPGPKALALALCSASENLMEAYGALSSAPRRPEANKVGTGIKQADREGVV